MRKPETKPFAIVDSNIIVYAMIRDYPDKLRHQKCLALLERGLKGQLGHILAINAIIIVEVFSALRKLLGSDEAEFRTRSLLRSTHLAFLSISKENCENSVRWAKEKNIPANDALIGANAVEHGRLIYTVDTDHFRELKEYNVKILNPTTSTS